MAWKPSEWLSRGKTAKATAAEKTPEDDTDEDDILDPDLGDEEEDKDEEGETPDPEPELEVDPDTLATENKRLAAENARLSAQLGEKPISAARSEANRSAVRLFGKGTPTLTEAKKLVASSETPGEAMRLQQAFDLAFKQSSLGKTAGVRQTARQNDTPDLDAEIANRAKAAAARTRPTAQ